MTGPYPRPPHYAVIYSPHNTSVDPHYTGKFRAVLTVNPGS
jgi:hypothetical protein